MFVKCKIGYNILGCRHSLVKELGEYLKFNDYHFKSLSSPLG